MSDNRPIGIFDSGIGGVSVWKELVKFLPNESFVYYADSENCPYGSKSHHDVLLLSKKITDFLISHDCKLIVVACNTATAAAIDFLRENYDIPFVGMEPAIKPAAINTKTKNIGVLATDGTFNGRLFQETSQKFASDISVHVQIGFGLVELVEKGMEQSEQAEALISKYLTPMFEKGVDQVVLGCTHYPFFMPVINKVKGDRAITIIEPADAIAKQTKFLLDQNHLSAAKKCQSDYKFFTNGNLAILKYLVSKVSDVDVEFVKL